MIRLARVGFAVTVAAFVLASLAAKAAPLAETGAARDANLKGDRFVTSKDYRQALQWYRYSAALGDAAAQVEVGYFYEHGIGAASDYGEAVHWYRLAADQGSAVAQNQLGYLFEHGLGVGPDYDQASRWFQLAAAQGSSAAQYNLAYLEAHGHHRSPSLLEARAWMIDAATAQAPPAVAGAAEPPRDQRRP